MGVIFGVLALIAGMNCFTCYAALVKKGEIKAGILLPKDMEKKNCRDVAGYTREIAYALLQMSVFVTLYGIAEIVNAYIFPIGIFLFVSLVMMGVSVVWFAIRTKKVNKKYFS